MNLSVNLVFHGQWRPLPNLYNLYLEYNYEKGLKGEIKCKGVHFGGSKKRCNKHFTRIWSQYLNEADDMDLDKRPPEKEVWTQEEIMRIESLNDRIRSLSEKNILFAQLPTNMKYKLSSIMH